MGGTTHTRRPENLKVDFSHYRDVAKYSLLVWIVEFDRAIKSRRIDDEQMKLTFTQSHLAERAKNWALGQNMSNRYAVGRLNPLKPGSNERLSRQEQISDLFRSF